MCCLFGLIDYENCFTPKQKEKIINTLSIACETRGIDATGFCYTDNGNIKIYKKPLPAHKMRFKFKGNPKIIMGHTRMTTQGSEKLNYNNHPFYSEKLCFALAHNGVIYNDRDLRKSEKLQKTDIQTDSYIAVQLIDKKNTLDFKALRFMAEKVEGSFCFTVLNSKNELFIVKGDNPMAVYDFDGFYIYASTNEILNKALNNIGINRKYKELKISCGDIIKIDENGKIDKESFDTSQFEISNFRYWGKYTYNRDYIPPKNKSQDSEKSFTQMYFEDIVNYGKLIGVSEEDIKALVCMGYDLADIEDILYEPEMIDWCLGKDKNNI